ncbi:hypothetical protein SUGI_0668650 [Cryptomeria japonica]|nr:hypothetical protein SUGI_0668360 [Cryptomeria japonica]GLJ33230.1 hypothetical protein SUGI_0668650 [Cryptomeria japonica]
MQLRELVISGCSDFQGFPRSIGCLMHLKKIVVRNGSMTRSLPREFCLQSLKHLELNGLELSSLPSSFRDLRNLTHFDLSDCRKLRRLSISFKELTLLQYLSLDGCSNLTLESDILENMIKLSSKHRPAEQVANDKDREYIVDKPAFVYWRFIFLDFS